MTTRRIIPHLFILFLFFLGSYSLLCKCTDTRTSLTTLPDRQEPAIPRNSIVVTDTFRIEVDGNYRIKQKPELCPGELDEILVELLLHGMFNEQGDLREVFVLDTTPISPYDLNVMVLGVPREMIYLGISNLSLAYRTVWEKKNCESGIYLFIIRTGLYQEYP